MTAVDASPELTRQVKKQMNRMPIHEAWEASYRTPGSEKTYEICFDEFVKLLDLPPDPKALDVGCGICANGVRLARRGYRVTGADCSQVILEPARERIEREGMTDRIDVRQEDILSLGLANESFDLTLCWGVLMDIPEARLALTELARVTRPGGYIVFEEINAGAPEAKLMRLFWQIFRGNRIACVETDSGFEQTTEFNHEKLFWRHTKPTWLEDQLRLRLCDLVARRPGVFSDAHLFARPKFLRSWVHAFNRFWIRRIGKSGLAYHNIYVFQKSLSAKAVA